MGASSSLQVVGAEMRQAREPSERLWRVTVSNLAEEEHTVRGLEEGCSCEEDLLHSMPASCTVVFSSK